MKKLIAAIICISLFAGCKKNNTIIRVPVLSTTNVASITQTTAISGGNITGDGGATITARGVVWSTSANPTVALTTKTTDGSGAGNFTSNVTSLIANTKYYLRAYATNSAGTAYGNEVSFTTIPQPALPILTTTTPSSITDITAASGGNITSDGGAAITARGVVWSTSTNPTVALTTKTTDGAGTGVFASNITGLTANTKYFVRAYATNSVGTSYGDELSFTSTSLPTSVTDIDGNTYPTIKIGSQLWMAENLRTTKYDGGAPIPLVTENSQWAINFNSNSTIPMMTWYNNDKDTYTANKMGALYNWYAIDPAINGNNKVCPSGWHVPTDAEWTTLTDFLGGESVAGGKLKSTSVWQSPNTGATNSSGFTGLPGGYRNIQGGFDGVGFGFWWSSTIFNGGNTWNRGLSTSNTLVDRSLGIKSTGLSVRCIRD